MGLGGTAVEEEDMIELLGCLEAPPGVCLLVFGLENAETRGRGKGTRGWHRPVFECGQGVPERGASALVFKSWDI